MLRFREITGRDARATKRFNWLLIWSVDLPLDLVIAEENQAAVGLRVIQTPSRVQTTANDVLTTKLVDKDGSSGVTPCPITCRNADSP